MQKDHFIISLAGCFETSSLTVKESVLRILKRRHVGVYVCGSKKFLSKYYR